MRVLVADDDPLNRDILRRLLERLGAEVELAADGEEALAAIEAGEPFDLAFLDLIMPRKNGLGVARAVRAAEVGAVGRLRLVALTGAEEGPAVREAGFDDFLQKPVGLAALRAILERRS